MHNKKITLNEAFTSGLKNHQLNNFKDAENFYKYILKKSPKHFGSIFYLGTLFFSVVAGLGKLYLVHNSSITWNQEAAMTDVVEKTWEATSNNKFFFGWTNY